MATPTHPPDPLTDDYARAGFGAHLPFGRRPVLLLVDPVRAYLVPGSPLYAPAFEAALESLVRLAAAARAAGVPVVFTGVAYAAGGLDGGLFYRKVPALKAFEPGSPLAEFDPRLAPLPGELVVTKQYASAFFGTSLASTLTAMGCDTVMLGGFSTSGCVRASALDALQHGFVPYLVREACGDRDPRPQEANLFDLQAKYAEVVGEAEAIERLRRAAPAAPLVTAPAAPLVTAPAAPLVTAPAAPLVTALAAPSVTAAAAPSVTAPATSGARPASSP